MSGSVGGIGEPRVGTSFSIRFSLSDSPKSLPAVSASGFGNFICPSSAPTTRMGDIPPISSVTCFHVQPFSRLMSRIFSVRSARVIFAIQVHENRVAPALRPMQAAVQSGKLWREDLSLHHAPKRGKRDVAPRPW